MNMFRILLVAIITIVGAYTVVVIADHGWGLLPIFYSDITQMDWRGQFNMDFSSFLILGSIWLMWRHHFAPLGLLFGLVIFAGGAPFLCAYLLIASFRTNGDVKELLLGKRRAAN
jgi:hypothetical protein